MIPPALQTVDEPLRSLVLSMLAVRPEQRPSAAQLAQALAQDSGPQKGRTLRSWAPALTALTLTAASLMLATWAGWTVSQHPARKLAATRNEAAQADGRTSGLAETASSVSREEPAARSAQSSVAEDPLPEPQPGQLRTNSKGLCPHPKQIPLNGACWARPQLDRELCEQTNGQMFKGLCYLPITPPARPPTSSPKPGQGGAQ